jgi:hypothetical protein
MGPGSMPIITSTPRNTAISADPGMPNASVGISAPPSLELLAASGPMTPSMLPLPNVSGLFEICIAAA